LFIWGNPIKIDDLEVPPFIGPPIYIYIGPLKLRVNNNTGNLQWMIQASLGIYGNIIGNLWKS
jgi:hypothetical protein